MNIPNFLGLDNFVWFIGVVENRKDPEKLGRIQVRILGHHSEKKEDIPTEELHWAWVIQPISSAAMNGIGEFSLGVVEGTWVVGFFKDSINCQEPVIFGTIGGISGGDYPYPKNQNTGFLDPGKNLNERPRKVKERIYEKREGLGVELKEEILTPSSHLYPRKEHALGNIIKENDINRLARNEKIDDTIVYIKRNFLDRNVKAADGSIWSEPVTPYDANYPFNKVKESESGHIFEVDDTRGVERLHIWHRSGSFIEYYPNGIKVEKVVNSMFVVVMAEKYEHIMNRYNLTTDGPYNLMVFNNANIVVTGNCNIKIGGTGNIQAGQKLNIESENISIKANSTITLQSGSSINLRSSSVNSNPAISQARESFVSGGIGIVRPVPPQPGRPNISVETEIKPREYPVPIPEFKAIKD